MDAWNDRTIKLIGEAGAERLAAAHVLVVGVGGVGGYAAEMLARSGVGTLTLVDADNVAVSNLNRQLIATLPNIDRPKVELFAERFSEINPEIRVNALQQFVTPDNLPALLDSDKFDYIIDAIDTVAPKVSLIAEAFRRGIPIISSMGAGGRMDVSKVGYFDLWATVEDGLARAVRQRLKALGLRRPLKVVASSEAPRKTAVIDLNERNKRSSYGTVAAIPAIFGIMLAQYVINKLIQPS